VDKTNYNTEGGKENSKLYNIIKSISKNIGSGEVQVAYEDSLSDAR